MYINLTCLPENYSPYFFLDLYHRFPKTFVVAVVDDEVVGYVMCRMETGFSETGRLSVVRKGHVISLAVLPEYRRRGIGRALVVEALGGMLDYRVSECYLEVRTSNEPAISMYEKLGFESVRRIAGYYRDGDAAVVMCRKLPF